MRKGEGERHELRGIGAGEAEHHTLVSGSLFLLGGTHHTAVYVYALLVYGADHAAAGGVETVFGLGVAYACNYFADSLGDVYVGVFAANLTAYDHEACGAESFYGHLGLRVLAEEFIEDGI